jgi:hypothetical protein
VGLGGWVATGGLGDKDLENQAAQTRFWLTNGSRGGYCVERRWFGWEKVRLSVWLAIIERRRWEVVLGTKISKIEPHRLGFCWQMVVGVTVA